MTISKLLATASMVTFCLSTSLASAATLNVWVRTGIGESFTSVVKAYNDGHADKVELTQVTQNELVQKYATAIAGGQAPDALSLDLIYNPAFAAAGQLEDLTDWAKSLPYFSSLSPSHVRLGTYEGKIYGLPLTTASRMPGARKPNRTMRVK